ncbi:hypothetical protein [Serratia marcescens]|uniref:hypothetical protein n=1 Tax=Serratia marcescens TaxID=615 RepID=UPI0025AAC4E5|nr:hypothetical protein [Serratia marcescens]MDN0031128.1 hypothetical protein [Serratia marcescens]
MDSSYNYKLATYQIAKHEAGHWLAAYKLGWGPRAISLRVPSHGRDHRGYAETSLSIDLKTIYDVRNYARGRVKILYSGVYAGSYDGTRFDFDEINKEVSPGGGAYSDFFKAEEIYFFYYNCLDKKKGWEEEFNPIIYDVELMVVMHHAFLDKIGTIFCSMATDIGKELVMSSDELVNVYNESPIILANHT